MTQQSHSWAYIQRKRQLEKIHAPQCSQQHYLQQPRHGNKLNVHQKRNGYSTQEYYSAIKKNEIMTTAAAWMDLGARILGDISQIKKDKYMISLIHGI